MSMTINNNDQTCNCIQADLNTIIANNLLYIPNSIEQRIPINLLLNKTTFYTNYNGDRNKIDVIYNKALFSLKFNDHNGRDDYINNIKTLTKKNISDDRTLEITKKLSCYIFDINEKMYTPIFPDLNTIIANNLLLISNRIKIPTTLLLNDHTYYNRSKSTLDNITVISKVSYFSLFFQSKEETEIYQLQKIFENPKYLNKLQLLEKGNLKLKFIKKVDNTMLRIINNHLMIVNHHNNYDNEYIETSNQKENKFHQLKLNSPRNDEISSNAFDD